MTAGPSYRDRRAALIERHDDGLILIRGGNAGAPSPNFFYLTGLHEPRAALLLAAKGVRVGTGARHPGPDYVRGKMVRQLLFLPRSNPLAARWGEDSLATLDRLDAETAGVEAVIDAAELEQVLGKALAETPVLYQVRAVPPTLEGPDDADAVLAAKVRNRFTGVELRDATGTVHEQRRLKDPGEVQAIERGIELTQRALEAAYARVRPGIREYEVEAEITRVYGAAGATHAFDPIVACGLNAVFPHYHANNDTLEEGRLLLIDTGAHIAGYCSDITRTVPVNGKFDARQREVYDAVLRAEREAIAVCRPGTLLADVHAKAFEVIRDAGFAEFFIHGTSHHLGLETHDVGDVHRPLAAGAVITVEPGIYLPDERLGVRIEDDVLVTDGEPRILSESIPAEADAIEARMA